MKVYGITGLLGTGKDEATKVFESLGYQHISLSDCLREEAKKRDIKLTRENLIDLGNKLRKKNHAGMLAELASQKATSDKVVFSSIRNIGEVKFFEKKYSEFKLVKIDAPAELIFKRLKKRGRENDPKVLEDLRRIQEKDMLTGIGEVINYANMVIFNNRDLEKLNKLVTNFIESDNRPDWDEYFLEIAKAVGARANCCRGRMGAILVRNKRIIATGYNGAPHGMPECSKVGCLLVEDTNWVGGKAERCVRTIHSELNAVIQAALHGVSTKCSTLYGHYKPCVTCTKALINAGVERIVVSKDYHDPITDKLLKRAGVELVILNPEERGDA